VIGSLSSPLDDARGASRLAVDLTVLVTDVVETMHENVAARGRDAVGLGAVAPAKGLTGFIYRRIRGVTRLVGTAVDVTLAPLAPFVAGTRDWPGRETLVGAINGVLGDHVEATDNPLQIRMQLRMNGQVVDGASREAVAPNARPRIVVAVHGLCMTDGCWNRGGHDHAERLARDLDAELIYLRYNSGRHVSTNGAQFARQLDAIVTGWPKPPEITLVGHSMGGLVIRSACAAAEAAGHAWVRRVKASVFIGTPHRGAPLERHGHGVDRLFAASPYTMAFTRLSQIRSAGITDLRHGSTRDAEWQGRDRFAPNGYACRSLPLPAHIAAFTIAGSRSKRSSSSPRGDGLVPVASALDGHGDADAAVASARSFIAYDTGHLDLLASTAVYARMHRWLVARRVVR
jgi:pimeloyl-ACP methyl ester carboxylesterase